MLESSSVAATASFRSAAIELRRSDVLVRVRCSLSKMPDDRLALPSDDCCCGGGGGPTPASWYSFVFVRGRMAPSPRGCGPWPGNWFGGTGPPMLVARRAMAPICICCR